MRVIADLFLFLHTFFLPRAALAAENLALRQQLAILRQSVKRSPQEEEQKPCTIWTMD